jgi:hypothetical protein
MAKIYEHKQKLRHRLAKLPAHFLRARSARHMQYMKGRHTRDKRVMKRVICSYDGANVAQMLCECYADVVQMRRASYARH